MISKTARIRNSKQVFSTFLGKLDGVANASKIVITILEIAIIIREAFKEKHPESQPALINSVIEQLPQAMKDRYGETTLPEVVQHLDRAMASLSYGKEKVKKLEAEQLADEA
jgi:hypothetical protein